MKILIVGKTRMNTGCCIGAISLDNNSSLRLLESNGTNPPRNTQYEIGQIWNVKFERLNNPVPPHTEDILVIERKLIGFEQNVYNEILKRTTPHRGSIDGLHNGLIQFTSNGSGYISERTGVPTYSTCFWIPDRDLNIEREGTKVRYIYHNIYIKKLAYVGFSEPISQIKSNTLVRVSLARWWAPEDSDIEKRCYLQLSGWY